MTEKKSEKPKEPSWVTAPAVNPLYQGATPAEIARVLLLRDHPKPKPKENN